MLKEILIVDNLQESIRQWGIQFFHNQIIQELAGGYFFVDVECFKMLPEKQKNDCGKCSNCIHPIPLKIAYFVIQARRMQLDMFKLTIPPYNDEIRESELVSYIPGGVRFRGKVLKKAQIIPAELGVVHVQEIG
uniref:Uncharacterized protein n=1 Tax=viral metagenome TaxID=1070528 RepID=A0A6M3XJ78_9ZZZZ